MTGGISQLRPGHKSLFELTMWAAGSYLPGILIPMHGGILVAVMLYLGLMSNTALLLIDIQKALVETGFYGNERNNKEAEKNAQRLLHFFRDRGWPIYHVMHNSTNPDSPLAPGKAGNAINPLVAPIAGEVVFGKSVNSGFIGTDLEMELKEAGIDTLVITGLTTEHCVSTTTRMAANLGFHNLLVADATAAFDKTGPTGKTYSAELVHEISLETLRDEFAEIVDVDKLLARLA